MDKIFLILLCGLPFSHMVFNKMDIWHGQGHWFQIGILALLCGSLVHKPKSVHIVNKPLACFTLWIGLVTAFSWYSVLVVAKNYPIKLFFPFFNFLCFVVFYKHSLEYLNQESIEKILKYLSYCVLVILGYCVLQKLNLDQFFAMANLPKGTPDTVVGTIGNTSHLAGYLAICQPLFFGKKLFGILSLCLLWLIILMVNSASGVITGIAVLIFYFFHSKSYKKLGILIGLCLVLGIVLFLKTNFFSDSHRFHAWSLMYNTFKEKPIIGSGMGILNTGIVNTGTIWRHAHLEYFQIALETGIIGLGLLSWCIFDYFKTFRTFKTNLTIRLASIFVGFCVLGLFSFPAHLWLLSSMGMIAYSWLFILTKEVRCENQTCNTKQGSY